MSEQNGEPRLLLVYGESREEIAARARAAEAAHGAAVPGSVAGGRCLAVVAESAEDARAKLAQGAAALDAGEARVWDSKGVYYLDAPLLSPARPATIRQNKLAYLFPGQGSQYVGMLAALRDRFPDVREALAGFDRALDGVLPAPLSSYIYPPKAETSEEEKAQADALTATRIAQPALGAVEMGLHHVLGSFGVEPDMAGGHSYGELSALVAANAFDRPTLARLSETRGRLMTEAAGTAKGTMAALDTDRPTADALVEGIDGVVVANHNAPKQVVVSGTEDSVQQVLLRAKERKIRGRELAVSGAFHSPLVAGAEPRFAEALAQVEVVPPRYPVYANYTAHPYAPMADSIRRVLARQLASPVEFVAMVESMYLDGARVFVEVGPRTVLTGLVGRILAEKPHLAVALDDPRKPGLAPLLHWLGQLAAAGAPVRARPS